MNYENIKMAHFIIRDNRFICHCRLIKSNEVVTVHVKNTGRGKEVLIAGALVALNYQPSPNRKTDYDLVAVKKGLMWINIDSQLPNSLAYEGILSEKISLPHFPGKLISLKREVTYGNSKFDLFATSDAGAKAFIEVKGMTLENKEVGAFPDAPTLRGLKHVNELQVAHENGYFTYVLFIVQFEKIRLATIHTQMQPRLAESFALAMADGVEVLAYNCKVEPGEVTVKKQVPFDLTYPFVDPNSQEN
ncbi:MULTISPECIES: DNA/RNA nuclease SfsA [Enterococcus]|jgi:sugar fermentation stimulation protein A|uniref:DNA/RNA nuclease SfsA n=1 Tax=Enterococcus TaxID=1350 RepID=UPI002806259D|nr:DNA/RNA nuclease SfsA [Enterococcus dispar]MDT2704582.1 DNA/RNA nuclease SfsA [Enterococcus dispar]